MNEGYHSILQSDMHDQWARQNGDLIYQACKREGSCKARTFNVNSININGMLTTEVYQSIFP